MTTTPDLYLHPAEEDGKKVNNVIRQLIERRSLVSLSSSTGSVFTIENIDDGAVGARLVLRHGSASPAANDLVGEIRVTGNDSSGGSDTYNSINFKIEDPTSGSEDSVTEFAVRSGGGAKTLKLSGTDAAVRPSSNGSLSLGTSTIGFANLSLTSGGTISWGGTNVTATHSAGQLAIDGSDSGFNVRVGSATSASGVFKQITILGSDTGSGAGGFIQLDVGASAGFSWGLGNKSSILGSAYTSTTALFGASSIEFGTGTPPAVSTVGVLTRSGFSSPYEVRAGGDVGGEASRNSLTGTSDLTANSTGVGTIKFKGATDRDSAGFIKFYIGTTAYFIPAFTTTSG